MRNKMLQKEYTMIKILADSSADYPVDMRISRLVTTLPLKINFGGDTYRDKVDLTAEEFYEKIKTSSGMPKSAQVSENDYVEAMKEMLEGNNDEIIVITLAAALSGTYSSAVKAAEAVDKKRIHVIDGSVTMLNGVLVVKAVELIEAGKNVKENVKEIKETIHNQHAVFSVSDLDFLKRGGRISSVQSVVGGMLNIKPILTLTNERGLASIDKAKGDKQLIKKLINYAKEGRNKKNPLMLVYAGKDALPRALEFQKELEEALGEKVAFFTELGAVIGTHTGPGLIGVGY